MEKTCLQTKSNNFEKKIILLIPRLKLDNIVIKFANVRKLIIVSGLCEFNIDLNSNINLIDIEEGIEKYLSSL